MGRRKPRPMKCGDLEPQRGTADATELGGDRQNASAMCANMTNFCPDGNYLLCNAAMQMLHCVCEWPQLPSTVPLTTCPQTGLEYFWVRMRVCAKIERYRGFVAMFWRERSLSPPLLHGRIPRIDEFHAHPRKILDVARDECHATGERRCRDIGVVDRLGVRHMPFGCL